MVNRFERVRAEERIHKQLVLSIIERISGVGTAGAIGWPVFGESDGEQSCEPQRIGPPKSIYEKNPIRLRGARKPRSLLRQCVCRIVCFLPGVPSQYEIREGYFAGTRQGRPPDWPSAPI